MKVVVNSPGTDKNTNTSVNGEYVKIENSGRSSIALRGYTLRDESNHIYTFSSFTLKGGKTVTVYSGKGANTSAKRYMGRGWHVWNNSGRDSATLRNATGAKLDGCPWKSGHLVVGEVLTPAARAKRQSAPTISFGPSDTIRVVTQGGGGGLDVQPLGEVEEKPGSLLRRNPVDELAQ